MRAKDFIPTPKPRNFVAKNAMKTTSGSGAHRDKKREQKQGYEKHKGKDVAEGSEDKNAQQRKVERDKQRTAPAQKARNTAQRKGLTQDKDGTYYAKEGVAEGMDPEKRSRLDDLIDQYRDSTDPNDYYDRDYSDPEDVIAMIRAEFGDRIADQVAAGADKMHFPRPGHTDWKADPLGWKKPIDRTTKAGKMYKQDSDWRKNTIKSRYKLSGKSATEGVAEGSLNEFAPGGGDGNGPFDYGRAIVEIGEDFSEHYNDEGAGADAAAIIRVGKTFMSAGMSTGIRAFYKNLDTQVRDHVAEQLQDQGFNVKQDIYLPYRQEIAKAAADADARWAAHQASPAGQEQAANEAVIKAIIVSGAKNYKPGYEVGSLIFDQRKQKVSDRLAELKKEMSARFGPEVEIEYRITIGGKPVHVNEQGVAEEHNDTFDKKSHQYRTTMKHAKNPTVTQRMAAHDIKPGVAGYRDRVDMLKDLERTGKLKKDEAWEDDDLGSMSKREFKRKELEYELRNEPPNNIQVVINGKRWKVFAGRGRPDSTEEYNYLKKMQAWAANKSEATGKKWEVYLTGAPVST